MSTKACIVADIGGTNSRFAVFEWGTGEPRCLNRCHLVTAEYSSFRELLDAAAEACKRESFASLDAAVFAIAGPILNEQTCRPTNIDWDIDLAALPAAVLPQASRLINDFVAQAYGVLSPLGAEAKEMYAGVSRSGYPKVVAGIGTGLGKAALIPVSPSLFCHVASEGGHGTWPIIHDADRGLSTFLRKKLRRSYLEWEDVLSGRGLEALFEYQTGTPCSASELPDMGQEWEDVKAHFADIAGRMCRDFVLEFLAYGGLYLSGGVLAKNPDIVAHEAFRAALLEPGHTTVSIGEIPVYLVDHEDMGLWGAASYANTLLGSLK